MNMGIVDRIIRVILAAAAVLVIALNQLSTGASVALGVIAVILLATAIFGICPLYLILGMSTRRKSVR